MGMIQVGVRPVPFRPSSGWFSGEYNANGAHPSDGAFNYGAPDYYIKVGGSTTYSSGGTTPGTAWDIAAFNDSTARAAYAGKVVGLLDGTYNLYDIFGVPSGGELQFSSTNFANRVRVAGGAAGNPTVVVAQSARGVILDFDKAAIEAASPGLDYGVGAIGAGGTDHVVIDGLHITNCNFRSITNYRTGGCSNLTIRNCRFTNQDYGTGGGSKNSSQFYTEDNDDIVIQHCRFEGGGASGDSGRHSVIKAYNFTNRITVEYCTSIGESSPNTGPFLHMKEGDVRDLTCRYCYVYSNSSTQNQAQGAQGAWGYFWGDGSASSVYDIHHNVWNADVASGRIALFYQETVHQGHTGTLSFYNNTFVGPYDHAEEGGFVDFHDGPPAAMNFYHNILSRPTAPGSAADFDLPALSALGTWDYNVYDSSPTMEFLYNSGGSSSSGLTAWKTDSSLDANSTETADPKFTGTGTEAEQFKLDTGSPALAFDASGNDVGAWGGASPPSQIGTDF